MNEDEVGTLENMRGLMRRTEDGAYVAGGAVVTGSVELGADANVWFGCVLRGDMAPIEVGPRTNLQDGTIVHVDDDRPALIGADVTVGHRALLHACTIGDRSLIGMGAIVLTGAVIGEESIVAAGALVGENVEIPPRTLVMGIPARAKRTVTDAEAVGLLPLVERYIERAKRYL